MGTIRRSRRGGWVAVGAFALTLLFAGVALAGPPWGTDAGSHQGTYLQGGDLPSASKLDGDWTTDPCDQPDEKANGCSFTGKKLWTAEDANAAVWQVHDIRWVFADAGGAQRFLAANEKLMSEGLPSVVQAPAVGSDARMWTAQGDVYGIGIEVIQYSLSFRVDNVVVKIFVAQGPLVKGKTLTPLMVAALGQKAVKRIRAAEPSGAPPPVVTPPPQPVETVPVTPTPEPTPIAPVPEPVPEPTVTPVSEPTPEPPPKPAREPGRLGRDVREHWRSGSLRKPYVFLGGAYSKALGSFKLPGGTPLREKNAFDIAVGAMLHPRAYFQLMFHREVWQVPDVQEVLVRRFELIYGLDVLALPPKWRVRPALMALLGFGLGFGRIDSLVGTPDPLSPQPQPQVEERKGLGIGGVFGGEFALHVRVTRKFEFAPYAGILAPAYTYTNDFPAADRNIEGERGFGRAWRWNVGLKIGFGGPE